MLFVLQLEELPESVLLGAYIEIDEERLGYKDIQALYASAQYPLKKMPGLVADGAS